MMNRWSRPTLHSHAILDGVAVLSLLLAPYVFGFARVTSARNLFWVLAGCSALYTLLTNFRGGVIRILPFGLHRVFDVIAAYFLMIGPVALDYRSSITGWQYSIHLILGALWIIAAVATRASSPAQLAEQGDHVQADHEVYPRTASEWAPWVFASGVAAVALAGWVIWSSGLPLKSKPAGQAGAVPDNGVAQGLKPHSIPGLVTPHEQGVNPAQASRVFEVRSNPDTPAFEPDRLEAIAGSTVCVHFTNRSTLNHYDNFMVVVPGKEQHVGKEGMKAGPEGGYIPILPNEIIAHTPAVAPGETGTTCFHVPKQPGEYPFISSARNRWTVMKGTLEVKERG